MKKYLHLLIALAIVLSMVFSLAVPASAATLTASLKGAEEEIENTENTEEEDTSEAGDPYIHTQQFMALLDAMDMSDLYTYEGRDADDDDFVTVEDFVDLDGNEIDFDMVFYFPDDNETINLRIWNVIDFNEENINDVFDACSNINYDYNFLKFYVDKTDYSVTASMDLLVDADQDITDVATSALILAHLIMEEAVPVLAPLAE